MMGSKALTKVIKAATKGKKIKPLGKETKAEGFARLEKAAGKAGEGEGCSGAQGSRGAEAAAVAHPGRQARAGDVGADGHAGRHVDADCGPDLEDGGCCEWPERPATQQDQGSA